MVARVGAARPRTGAEGRMRRMRRALSLAILATLLLVGLLAAGLVARTLLPARAPWLSVKAPTAAVRGRPFRIVARLARPEPGSYLTADLHAEDSARRYLGYVAGAPVQRVVPGRRVYSFDIIVPDRGGLSYVEALLYLSKGGDWGSRVSSARLDPVPIQDSLSVVDGLRLRPAAAYPITEGASPSLSYSLPESIPWRIAASLAWAACAALCLAAPRGRRSVPLGIASLLACAWEAVAPAGAISEAFRSLAGVEGWYILRSAPQRFMDGAALAVGICGAILVIRATILSRRTDRGLAWLALCAYAGIAFLVIVSHHGTDALFARPVAGIPAGQAGRLSCAALASAALFIGAAARRRDSGESARP